MCDTLVALAGATARGGVLFAKNSDRERNEAQVVEMIARRSGDPAERVRLTYIDIADAAVNHACLISRPFWMWGAEMGANEHGVVIGNEAMHSTVSAGRRRALTGMDLVRLGLERAATAKEAVEVITALLERHGQGGDCGHLNRFYYHNGFMIVDRSEAYVLETVGRWWAVERVQDVRALSNALSIGETLFQASPALLAHAESQGWRDAAGRFHFAERLIDAERDAVSFGRGRCARGAALLRKRLGQLDVAGMAAVLRDHGAEAEDDLDWTPDKTVGRSICMHATHGARRSQSVASMISDLRGQTVVHWVTGTSAPCLSLFKPLVLGVAAPLGLQRPSDRCDDESLWWRHERLHRGALNDLLALLAALAPERDTLEARFRQRMDEALGTGGEAVADAVRACWSEAETFERRWTGTIASHMPAGKHRMRPPTARAWGRLNLAAAMTRA